MWEEIRKLFPVHERCVYLNNAGVCPPSLRVLEALQAYHRMHACHGWKEVQAEYRQTGTRIKAILARILGCEPSSLALVHNTSEGMSVVAQGLSWKPGDVVLGLDREYPANVYPWWNLQSRGVRYVRLTPTRSDRDLSALERRMEERVRVVTISAVDWCSGHAYDLGKLGEACRKREILLVVDMAQALGTVPLDAAGTGAAAMAGSAWKGLMGPVGVGIFYCSPSLLEQLSLIFVGTDSVVDAQNYLDYCFVPRAGAARFEFSTANVSDWVYLLASLEWMEEIGFENVRARILALNDFLREGLDRRGYTVLGPAEPAGRSGILAFWREGMDVRAKVAELAGRRIVVAERDGFLRVSPHIYNNEEDLEQLLRQL